MRGDALRACLFSFDDSVKIVFDLTNAAPLFGVPLFSQRTNYDWSFVAQHEH